jgi:hypothetical protein
MQTNLLITDGSHPVGCKHALRRELECWHLTFKGRQAVFQHELGALYVAYLLLQPPREPIHGVALALKTRETLGHPAGPAEILQERAMELEDAVAVRALWRHQRELERVLADRLEIEPVKAEAQRELEDITEHLRQSPWLSQHGAERSARAVAAAIRRFYVRLVGAVDAEGKPDEVLRAFALHLHEYLLVPSGRAGAWARAQAVPGSAGCFIYLPPRGVVWEIQGATTEDGRPRPEIRNPNSEVRRGKAEGKRPDSEIRGRPAAVGYLGRFLSAGLALALMATGCVGPRPLKGGKAVTTHKPAGIIEQTLVQGENPSQATKQDQETVKVRTYTVPAGSRVEQSSASDFHDPQYERSDLFSLSLSPSKGERVPKAGEGARQLSTLPPSPSACGGQGNSLPRQSQATAGQPSTINPQPSTAFVLSSPMPVVEREETRARTELGAAQKDTARELGAKLSSLKGIVWVGVGLFVFGLASLVWPPLKVIVGSVTTSAALMLGGVALMVLPSMVVGNELLILGVVGIAVGGWFVAHRHGELRGQAAASAGGQTAGSNQSSVNGNQSPVANGQ